jgi:hypothetical protein
MAEDKTQINFQTSTEDAAAIDALAALDGYDNRSAWVRYQLRQVINTRRVEIVTVKTHPHPVDAQVIPVIYIGRDEDGPELSEAVPA